MNRRNLLQSSGAALGAGLLASSGVSAKAGQFTGKIRKSLKWGMVAKREEVSLVDAFRKLRECGFEGIEPSIGEVPEAEADAWVAASRESGLIIDGTVAGRTQDLGPAIDLTKKLGGDSMLVVARYDTKQPIQPQWDRTKAELKEAAPHAEKQGVKLLVENVWATFLISPFDMARYIDEIGHPWVQVHFDVGNMMRWGVAEHWAQVLGKRSQKLDIKEYDLKKAMSEGMAKGFDVPLGEGSINWPAVREELAKIDYTGWAAAEVRGGDWDHLADIAKRMDRVLDL
ncbi:MAG: sugar phosphate isomerase/epimerase [Verrucomicrobiae bacterium]|nr:sugar phosphate isomerase/epimerase [Verrucomicrobiae bacterium]